MEEDSVKQRLLAFMKYKKLSQSRFEKMVGLSNGYINSLRHSPSADKLSIILKTFPEVNRTWLLTGEGSMLSQPATSSPRSPVPVYDIDVSCGLTETRTYSDMPLEGYIDIPSISRDAIVVKSHGDSMLPTVHDGDYVAIRRIEAWDYIMFGNIYVVELPDYRAMKRIRKGSDDNHIILRSDNDDYDDVEVPKADIRSLWVVENIISIKKLF